MLFRRFIILTVLIAFGAVLFINIVEANNAPHRDFAVGDRLKQWEEFEKKRACPRDDRMCDNGEVHFSLA